MQLLTSTRFEATDAMRELVLEEWPELAHKLAPIMDKRLEINMASTVAKLEAEVARLHNAQLQLESELENVREDLRQAREALRELQASENSDSKLLAVANATLRRVKERERAATNALAAAVEQRKTAEAQLAGAKEDG